MAGRPRKRARERAEARWFPGSREVTFSSDARYSRLLRKMGGCDTSDYDVGRTIETGGLPIKTDQLRHHQRTLPRFVASGNDHTTAAGRYEIVTRCKNGALDTGVY